MAPELKCLCAGPGRPTGWELMTPAKHPITAVMICAPLVCVCTYTVHGSKQTSSRISSRGLNVQMVLSHQAPFYMIVIVWRSPAPCMLPWRFLAWLHNENILVCFTIALITPCLTATIVDRCLPRLTTIHTRTLRLGDCRKCTISGACVLPIEHDISL